jgi:hypothetical protein
MGPQRRVNMNRDYIKCRKCGNELCGKKACDNCGYMLSEFLPKKAKRLISARQRSYIDEFDFHKTEDGRICAYYGGSLLAIYSWKKGWEEGKL